MKPIDPNACNEYNELSRRRFLVNSGKVALAASLPAWLPKVAYAATEDSDRDVIVSIYLRGGADGLTLCVPFHDDHYYQHRTTTAVPRPDSSDPNRGIDLDGRFCLPQAMRGLMDSYRNGDLLIVHATGSKDPTRSHFDAQRYMEVGKPGDPFLFSGWLGRHLATSTEMVPGATLRSVGLTYGMPRTLNGAPKTLPIPNMASFGLTGDYETKPARKAWLDQVYSAVDDPVKAAAKNSQRTIDILERIGFYTYRPGGGATYPVGSFGFSLMSTAALIKANVGVEAVHIDLGGWDTHNAQGVHGGQMHRLMEEFASGVAAFHKDMWATGHTRVVVVILSEFGRVVRENASAGTDHGHGNCLMVLGAGIQGGRVLTEWPGLHPDQLYQRQDLQTVWDYRDILGEIVERRLNNPNLGAVFPGYTPTFRGVTR